jgi:hypothetical protein
MFKTIGAWLELLLMKFLFLLVRATTIKKYAGVYRKPTGWRKLIVSWVVHRQARDSGVPAKIVEAEWRWRVEGQANGPQA